MADFFHKTGDIFTSTTQVLVNPVNCVGVSGAGLAKQFWEKFPEEIQRYEQAAKIGCITLGQCYTIPIPGKRWIFCLPTKNHWREKSDLQKVGDGIRNALFHCHHMVLESIAFPPVGCGLGGLDWRTQVMPLILEAGRDIPDLQIHLYHPIRRSHDPSPSTIHTSGSNSSRGWSSPTTS